MRGGRRIYRPPIPPRWPLLAQEKWCACVLSTRWGSTSELVIDNFNVLVQVVSLGIFLIYIHVYIYGTTPPGTYIFNKSAVICSVFVENRRSPHRLRNSKSRQCQSARNLHMLNNFNSSQCLSVRNLHRLNNFNFFNFFLGLLVRRHLEVFRFLSGEMHETCRGSIISILLGVKVHETCTGSIISIFQFLLKNIVPPDQKS